MDIEKLFKKLSKEYRSHKFTGICLDSRNCKKGDLFLSIHGETKNGNQFINDAIKNGAKIIISNLNFQEKKK